jgi:hypothetical protein
MHSGGRLLNSGVLNALWALTHFSMGRRVMKKRRNFALKVQICILNLLKILKKKTNLK